MEPSKPQRPNPGGLMAEHDCLRRFLFADRPVRGVWVRLEQSWQAAKRHQDLPAIVQQPLGQAMAAVALLSVTLKFNGSLILQAHGSGLLRTLVAQATCGRTLRGLAKLNDNPKAGGAAGLFGDGQLALTVEQDNADPYQGIVPLQDDDLATALAGYFSQSEQLATRFWLVADERRAAGLLLQALPPYAQADWAHIGLLAGTLSGRELLALPCAELLRRLFAEETLTLYEPEPLTFACACSQAKIERTLRGLGAAELEAIIGEQGEVAVSCEFCGARYRFGPEAARLLLADGGTGDEPRTFH